MPVSHEFEKLLGEFREAHVRFENEDFSVWASPVGLIEQAELQWPVGWATLIFVDQQDDTDEPEVVWDKGYFFTFEPHGPTMRECEQVFAQLAERATAILPEEARSKLTEYSPYGAPFMPWLLFLLTQAKDVACIQENRVNDLPLFVSRRPFADSADAIEFSGLVKKACVAQPPLPAESPAELKYRRSIGHLQFRPGEFEHAGVIVQVVGKQWEILKALVEARRALTVGELRDRVWKDESDVEDTTIRSQVSLLRTRLRTAFRLSEDADPIPVIDAGKRKAWRLDAKILKAPT